MPSPAARIPVKVHKNVSLVRTSQPIVADELMARKSLARLVTGRLSETLLLVRPEDEAEVLDELRRAGHSPRVVR
jgi:hypothetical protein